MIKSYHPRWCNILADVWHFGAGKGGEGYCNGRLFASHTEGPLETSELQRAGERTRHTCPLKSRVPCVLQLKGGVRRFRLAICSVALQTSLAVPLLESSKCEEDIPVSLYRNAPLSDGDTF